MRSLWDHCPLVASLAVFLACAQDTGTKGTADNYVPDADEFGVQIIGDSYFDFRGYIPIELVERSGKVYEDRSRSGATIEQITTYYEDAREDEAAHVTFAGDSATYEIKTVLVDGGANNIRKACMTKHLKGTGFDGSYASLPDECKEQLDLAIDGASALIDRTRDDGIADIVWLGPHYFHPDTAPPVVMDTFADAVSLHCQTKRPQDARNNCHFVEVRGVWLPEDATQYFGSDQIHVNEAGAARVSDLLWEVMETGDVHR